MGARVLGVKRTPLVRTSRILFSGFRRPVQLNESPLRIRQFIARTAKLGSISIPFEASGALVEIWCGRGEAAGEYAVRVSWLAYLGTGWRGEREEVKDQKRVRARVIDRQRGK